MNRLLARLYIAANHPDTRIRLVTRTLIISALAWSLIATYILGDQHIGLPTPDDLTTDAAAPTPTP